MSVVKQIREPRADYLALEEPALLRGFELLATAEGGVAKLRNLILSLAVRGLLTQKDPDDEPASELILEVQQEKKRLIDAGALKRTRPRAAIIEGEQPYSLPTGWEWVRLNDLLIKIGAGSTPLGGREVYTTAGIKFLRSQNVWNHGLALAGVARIPTAVHDKMSGTKVIAGDLLFNITGASIGRCALVPDSFDEANVSQHVTIIRTALPNIRRFLHLVLISAHVQQTVMDVQVGVSREGLSIGKLGQFVIPLPPLAEQHRIVARVEELMTLCDELEARGRLADEQHARLTTTLFDALTASDSAQTLADNWQRIASHFDLLLDRPQAIDALEQTILQLAVRGLLVPQDPTDESASELLRRVRTQKDQLIAEGKIKHAKPLPPILDEEKPFELPVGWKWVRVGSVGVTQTGGTPASNKPEYFDGNFPFIGPGQITPNGEILPPDKFISELGRSESVVAEPGDILMVCIGGSIGKCAAASFPTAFNQQINSIHPLLASSEFILTAMTTNDFVSAVVSTATGSATPIISKGKWDLLLLPIPPLAEQQRIVARVEQLRSLCDDLRRRLNKVRATQTHLAETLATEVVQPRRGIRLG